MITVPLLVVAFLMVLILGFVLHTFLVAIPRTMASLFRYRLWRLRDALVDDVLFDRIENTPEIEELRGHLETAIRTAEHLTPGKLAVVAMYHSPRAKLELARRSTLLRDDHKPSKREAEFGRLALRHLLFGSPTGWMFSVILFGLLLPIAVAVYGTKRVREMVRDSYVRFGQFIGSLNIPARHQSIVNYA